MSKIINYRQLFTKYRKISTAICNSIHYYLLPKKDR